MVSLQLKQQIVCKTCVQRIGFKEPGILAKWLMGVTVGLAAKEPGNMHSQYHGIFKCSSCKCIHSTHVKCFPIYRLTIPRLRAAVFVNMCGMRDAVTLRQGPLLTDANRQKLETANYLFHSALN